MRLPSIVALAAVALTSVGLCAPAHAQDWVHNGSGVDWVTSWRDAVSDDDYPPRQQRLSPYIHALVRWRDGRGTSLYGFYNDPDFALMLAARQRLRDDSVVLRRRY